MTSARSAAVARQQAPQTTIEKTIQSTSGMVDLVQRLMPTIADALPAAFTPERMAGIVSNAIRRSEIAKATGVSKWSLHDCTPESFVGAILAAAAAGLEPGTDEAWLIPYRNVKANIIECQMQIGYQGLLKMFWRHPDADWIVTDFVCERDVFEVQRGTDPKITHLPATGERGDVVAFYAAAGLVGKSRPSFVVLTPPEVRALRGKEGPNGGIKDPQHWMSRKTVLKQLMKTLPKARDVAAHLDADEQSGTRMYAEQIAPAARRQNIVLPQLQPAPQQPTAEQPEQVDPQTGEVAPEWYDDAAAGEQAD